MPTDERGLLIAAQPRKLVVPPGNQFVATRLLETELRVSTADNDINAIKNNGSIPEGYTINFNIIKPQDELSANSTQLKVPAEPVIFLAYAKALAERGEDGGLRSSEAYQLYQTSLADHISIEGNKYPDEFLWDSV